MRVLLDTTDKYKCPICGNSLTKAISDDNKEIFVHETANYYAEHNQNTCPQYHNYKYGLIKIKDNKIIKK